MVIDRTNLSVMTRRFVRSNNSICALQSISHDFCKNIPDVVPKFARSLQCSKVLYILTNKCSKMKIVNVHVNKHEMFINFNKSYDSKFSLRTLHPPPQKKEEYCFCRSPLEQIRLDETLYENYVTFLQTLTNVENLKE